VLGPSEKDPDMRDELLIFVTPKILREGSTIE